jgi:hypothetical protein
MLTPQREKKIIQLIDRLRRQQITFIDLFLRVSRESQNGNFRFQLNDNSFLRNIF